MHLSKVTGIQKQMVSNLDLFYSKACNLHVNSKTPPQPQTFCNAPSSLMSNFSIPKQEGLPFNI